MSTIIENLLVSNEQFYEIRAQLNEGQQHLLNFVILSTFHCKLTKKNNEMPPKSFQKFLSGGAWCWKKLLNHCNNQILKSSSEISNAEPWSTICSCDCIYWKNWCRCQWYYIRFTLHLPVMSRLRYWYKKPSDKTVYMLSNKYLHLRVLIIDEISMTGRRTFGHFYLALKAVIQNSLPFGGVSML